MTSLPAAITIINCVSFVLNFLKKPQTACRRPKQEKRPKMTTAGFRRLTFSVRGIVNFSTLIKQVDVAFAKSGSLKSVNRGILPSRQTGVSKSVNVCTHTGKIILFCGIEYHQQNAVSQWSQN